MVFVCFLEIKNNFSPDGRNFIIFGKSAVYDLLTERYFP